MMGYVDNSYFPMSFATRIAKEKLYAKVDGEKVDLFKIPLESIYIMDITQSTINGTTAHYFKVGRCAVNRLPNRLREHAERFHTKDNYSVSCEFWADDYRLRWDRPTCITIEKRLLNYLQSEELEKELGYKLEKARIGIYPRELFTMPNARSVAPVVNKSKKFIENLWFNKKATTIGHLGRV